MKRLVITEEQASRLIDSIINEQSAGEFLGSTNAQRITHANLTKLYGLPNGAQNEFRYYTSTVGDIIKHSGTAPKGQLLSIFTPADTYTDDPTDKELYDYFEVEGKSIERSGNKAFQFNNPKAIVYASHNGLLAIARAMEIMKGRGGVVTINFGTATKGQEALDQKASSGTVYSTDRAFSLSSSINGVQDALVRLAAHPDYVAKTSYARFTPEQTKQFVINNLNRIVSGYYLFLPNDPEECKKIIANLTPKGFVSTTDWTEVTNVLPEIEKMESVADFTGNPRVKLDYNEGKRRQLNDISDKYFEAMCNKAQAIYSANLKIFIDNYLPNSKAVLYPRLKNITLKSVPLGEWQHIVMTGTRGPGSQTNSSLDVQNKQYGAGY